MRPSRAVALTLIVSMIACGVSAAARSMMATTEPSNPLDLSALIVPDQPSRQKPQRIVSLNMCLDELAIRLADRKHVASVLWMSRDPLNSNVSESAKMIPGNGGTAEEAVSFHPDLVLVGEFTSAMTKSMLKRVGMPVSEFGVPENFAAVRAQIRKFGTVIGERGRADEMVHTLDRDLAAISFPSNAPKLKAIILRPNGFTVGAGSLVDEILERAGLENLAAKLDIGPYEQVPLERIALLGADILIVNSEHSDEAALATEGLKHPLIGALSERTRVVSVPSRLWTCAGPNLVEAVRLLQHQTSDLRPQAILP